MYELAFGSKLNLKKTTIIPFNLPNILAWLQNSDCFVSSSTALHKYLGTCWGANLALNQLHTFFQRKIDARLSSWSTRYLSFAGRVLLIKHVLQAIPIYCFLFNKTPLETLKKNSCFFKDFLWGSNLVEDAKLP